MKKLLYISALIVTILSFTGCYADRAVVVARPHRVMVAPYYYPAPVVVHTYGGRGWYRGGGHYRY